MLDFDTLRSLLFRLDPEFSHHLSLQSMATLHAMGCAGLYRENLAEVSHKPKQCMGINFPNAIGLAAGLDKNGDFIDALGDIGFGFLEIGTVTPKPQPGNPKPRLFRLPESEAIINRMGFNNKGVEHLVRKAEKRRYQGVLGINIGKNFDTSLEEAHRDYLTCLDAIYAAADYVTVNLSSPNTPGLRKLQVGEALRQLIDVLVERRVHLSTMHGKQVPMLIKIAPDMTEDELGEVGQTALACGIDGIIATNTTLDRNDVVGPYANEAGGLSGKPVFKKSTRALSELAKDVKGRLCLVGVGGIFSGEDAEQKIAAGADLLQIYSGFIFKGPKLVKELLQ